MRVIFGLLFLLTNIAIFGAEFKINAKEREALIQEYLERYAQFPVKMQIIKARFEGNSIDLILSVRKGDIGFYRHFFEPGTEIEAIYGAPLKEAASHGNNEIIKLLVEWGSNVDYRGPDGWTSLHYAANKGHVDSMELLKEFDADEGVKDESGRTPQDLLEAFCLEGSGIKPAKK